MKDMKWKGEKRYEIIGRWNRVRRGTRAKMKMIKKREREVRETVKK